MSRDAEDARPTESVAALFLDDAPVGDETLQAGTQIGPYVIERQIGSGGMGVVYAATHPVIGKRVAIKVLRRELSDDASAIERFTNEARAVNAIGHPNIVDIFDLGTLPDGRQYLAMDLLEGETLRQRIDRGPVHVSIAAKLIDDIASALIATHEKSIIHRDLKPDNVFVVERADRHPEARLLDFGIAKLVAANHPEGSGVRTRLGAILGTPGYMSPEQARARSVDHRTDIYALGVIGFELLAGRRPYERTSVMDLLVAHAEAPVPSIVKLAPSVPVEVAQLVEAMLAKQPADRPTLAAARTVLKRLKSTLPSLTEARAAVVPEALPSFDAPASSTLPTRDEGPERLSSTMPFSPASAAMTSMPRVLEGSFEMAIVQMNPGESLATAKRMPSPLKVVPTASAQSVSVTDSSADSAAITTDAPAPRSRLWIVFLLAALAVAIGGVLLGMRL